MRGNDCSIYRSPALPLGHRSGVFWKREEGRGGGGGGGGVGEEKKGRGIRKHNCAYSLTGLN